MLFCWARVKCNNYRLVLIFIYLFRYQIKQTELNWIQTNFVRFLKLKEHIKGRFNQEI